MGCRQAAITRIIPHTSGPGVGAATSGGLPGGGGSLSLALRCLRRRAPD
jgi:hypothetical protein